MAEALLQIAVPGPFPFGLTYLFEGAPSADLIGRRVWVPLRKRKVVGIVTGSAGGGAVDSTKLKSVISFLDPAPLISPKLKSLVDFMRDYYHVSLGDAYYTALPSLICAGKPLTGRRARKKKSSVAKTAIHLNPEQQAIKDAIGPGFAVHLIEGVTGSGKTEVYLKCAEAVLAAGQSVLILVPEIGLAPQILERFATRLGESVLAYHSGLTEAQKRDCWFEVWQGEIKIVIGTRSAVFLPFPDLGLIVIDEEHDASYKQQTGVHYSAKSIALMRGKQEGCCIILGSATPSSEAYYFAEKGIYQHHRLQNRALAKTENTLKLIDMRKYKPQAGMSLPLLERMAAHLRAGNQVLIFLNRRGYAPVLMCGSCSERLKCPACEMSYTLHHSPPMLLCHHCGRTLKVPKTCASCSAELITLGQGTQQLETYIADKFADFTLLRLDQDATRKKGELEAKLAQIKNGEAQIIIGTQMIAKGHDFANITWVGIIDLDYGFFAPDFRGIERMGQVLTQVSGRAGRGEKAGEVMIQTHVPDHPLLQCLLKEGYGAFANRLLADRKFANWPPYQYLAILRAEAKSQETLFRFLEEVKSKIIQQFTLSVLGPVPAFLKRKNNYHRAQLVLESPNRAMLHAALSMLETLKDSKNQVRFYVDVDPIEMG